jgi:hypothetical protein
MLAQAPQARRVETDDDDAPFRNEHALDLAQREVRVAGHLERMRKNDEIEAVAVERQRVEVAVKGDADTRQCGFLHDMAGVEFLRGHPSVRHAIRTQRVEFDEAELQSVKSEQIHDNLIEMTLFPVEQIAPAGA